jgi:hypothetical protein
MTCYLHLLLVLLPWFCWLLTLAFFAPLNPRSSPPLFARPSHIAILTVAVTFAPCCIIALLPMLPPTFRFVTLIAPGADSAARTFLAALVDLTVVYSCPQPICFITLGSFLRTASLANLTLRIHYFFTFFSTTIAPFVQSIK